MISSPQAREPRERVRIGGGCGADRFTMLSGKSSPNAGVAQKTDPVDAGRPPDPHLVFALGPERESVIKRTQAVACSNGCSLSQGQPGSSPGSARRGARLEPANFQRTQQRIPP